MIFSAGLAWAEDVGTASSGGDVGASCDPKLMKAMENQSAMQGQQDVETAQNVISKPDSVLEYTCFDQYASVTATEGGEIFSDADMSVDTGGLLGDDFFDSLIEDVLSDVLSELLPDEFFQMMDFMSGLDSASMLLQMSQEELENALGNVSIDIQIEMRDKILSELPPEATIYLDNNPATQSLEELMSDLNSIPVNIRANLIPSMSNAELENFLSMLPSDALDELMGGLSGELGIGGGNANEENLDAAIEGVVLSSLKSYTDQNFDHDFLGGRIPVNYEPSDKVGGDYNCDRMNQVWQMAKCQNFEAIPSQDGFKTLTDYAAGADPRQLPEACTKSSKWSGMHDAANPPPDPVNSLTKESDGNDCSKATIVKGRELIGPDGKVVSSSETCSAPGCVPKGGACVKAP